MDSVINLIYAAVFILAYRQGVYKQSFNWGYVYKAALFIRAAFLKKFKKA